MSRRPAYAATTFLATAALVLALAIAPTFGQTNVSGAINTDTTWTLAGSPYTITATVTVSGTDGGDGVTTLTIEPGVVVELATSTYLAIGGTSASIPGALIADGDAAGGPATITFTSSSLTPAPGDHRGVWFQRGARDTSVLRNASIQYAGGSNQWGLYINQTAGVAITADDISITDSANYGMYINQGTATVSDCTIESNSGHDVYIHNSTGIDGSFTGCGSIESVYYNGGGADLTWTGNTFNDWGATRSRIAVADVRDILNGNTINLAGGGGTDVVGGTLAVDSTWNDTGGPLEVVSTITVDGSDGGDNVTTLTLEPGVEMQFNVSQYLAVGGTSTARPGALIADGNAGGGPATITFTASNATAGGWRGIYMQRGAVGTTVVRNAIVRYAGGSNGYSVYINQNAGVAITLDDVTVTDSANYGIYANYGTFIVENSTVVSNGNHDLHFANSTGVVGTVQDCVSIESVYYAGAGPSVDWTGNTFDNWGATTSRIDLNDAGNLLSDNTLNLAGGGVTEIIGGTMTEDASWPTTGGPLVIVSTITVDGTDGGDGVTTLTIEPGVELRFNNGTYLAVGGTSTARPGALIADGDAAGGPATITMAASNGTPGGWRGVFFQRGAVDTSMIRNASLQYAGGSNQFSLYFNQNAGVSISVEDITITDSAAYGVYANYGTFNIDGCTIESSALFDIYLVNSNGVQGTVQNCASIESVWYPGNSPDITWSNNTFNNYGATTSQVSCNDAGSYLSGGNTFNLEPDAVTNIVGGTINESGTWSTDAGPLEIQSAITVQADTNQPLVTLTIEPGAELRFGTSQYLAIGGASLNRPGALVANGDAAGGPAEITFTSSQAVPTPGDWRGIWFQAAADESSILRKVLIRYGGGSFSYGAYFNHQSANPIVLNQLRIRDSAYYGMYFARGRFDMDACQLQGSGYVDIYLGNSSNTVGTVDDCSRIESIEYTGVNPDVAWTNNTFENWGGRVSVVPPDEVEDLGVDNTFNKAAVPADVEILQGTASLDGTWRRSLADRYLSRGVLTIQGTDGPDTETIVTFEPGIEYRSALGGRIDVGGIAAGTPGALIADGNGAGGPATILLTSNQPTQAAGDWSGIYLRAGAGASSLVRNATIRYAGRSGFGGIYAVHQNGTLPIEDVLIADSFTMGLYVNGDIQATGLTIQDSAADGIQWVGDQLILSDCAITGSAGWDIELASAAAIQGSVQNCTSISSVYYVNQGPTVTWSGNTFNNWGVQRSRLEPDVVSEFIVNNTFNAIGGAEVDVTPGTVERDSYWDATVGNPYHLTSGAIAVQGEDGPDTITTLTMAPGLELRFPPSGRMDVGGTAATTPGALIADGDAAGGPALIRFTSDQPAPAAGDWSAIYFRAGAKDNTLIRNARIDYAGSGGWAGIYLANQATDSMTFDNVAIVESANYGIYGAGPFDLSNCTIGQNDDYDVYIAGGTGNTGSVQDCASIESVYYNNRTARYTWDGNTFDNWGTRQPRISDKDADAFSHGNTFNPIPGAYVEMLTGPFDEDATWTADPGPYEIVSGTLHVQGTAGGDGKTTLRLDPGVTLRPLANTWIQIGSGGTPGELIADGRLGMSGSDVINLTSREDVPVTGDWNGIYVFAMGRLELYETQIRYADAGITSAGGTIGVIDGLFLNRVTIGVDLAGGTVETDLNRIKVKNADIGIRTANVSPVIRNSDLVGATWGVQNTTPATTCVDAMENWWGATDGPDPGTSVVDACVPAVPTGMGSAITEAVEWANFQDIPEDDGDGIPSDSGQGFPSPCTGGNTVNCDDNCPLVANASQGDVDNDGVGDACDGNPILRVSSDPADGADFSIVQDAVDAAFESGTTVEVLTGLGPYFEPVRVDRAQVFTFQGVENLQSDPVIVDGGSGPAFRVIDKVGGRPMEFRDLTLRGGLGVRTAVDTDLQDIVFDQITGDAMQFDAGNSAARRVSIAPMTAVGARVSDGASFDLRVATMTGLLDAGVIAAGSATLENVLIAAGNGADGIRLTEPTASVDATFVTLADNTGVGIDNTIAGAVTLDRSVAYGNAMDDLVNVGCGSVTWSLTEFPDCSGGGDNVTGDPMFDAGFHQTAGSPCLDHGPDPALYTGDPPTDTAGNLRLRDWNSDGLATTDCGAFEEQDATITPGEVAGLTWDFNFRLLWDVEPSAVEYHVYRDLLSNLTYSAFGACNDGLDSDRTDTQLDDLDEPAPGAAFIYLITADDGANEGTLGFGSSAERSNFSPCP